MSRRISLPGAEELFRSTGPETAEERPELGPNRSGEPVRQAAFADSAPLMSAVPDRAADGDAADDEMAGLAPRRTGLRQRARAAGDRRPTGRERHDEKITVYVSPNELMDLEQARLTLRGDFGLVVDRGRIVREALAVVLADLEAKGDASILVRRLLGR